MHGMKLQCAAIASLLFCTMNANAVTVSNTLPPDGFSAIHGDLWTFYCPKDGTYSLAVDTDSVDYPADVTNGFVSRSALDPAAVIWDSAGNQLLALDNEVACSIISNSGNTCPTTTDSPCGTGARHYAAVYSKSTNTAGAYTLTVTIKDSLGNPLPNSKVKLGGGPKPRVPKFLDLGKTRAAPLVNDAQLVY